MCQLKMNINATNKLNIPVARYHFTNVERTSGFRKLPKSLLEYFRLGIKS